MGVRTEKEWLTIAELQDWLGLGRSKAYELTATREIPSYRIGRILRVRRQDVEQWLEQHCHQPGE
jgi:excisionase family DNA binding protein